MQQACWYHNDPDQMYAYLHAALGPHPDEEKLSLYCDGSVEHFEWFCSLGIEFRESLYDGCPGCRPPRTD